MTNSFAVTPPVRALLLSSPGAVYLTAIVLLCFAPIVSIRFATVNAGLSVVKVNCVSVSNTFLKSSDPDPFCNKIGPTGLGGTHLPETGTTYDPPESDSIKIRSRKFCPTAVGSNVTETLSSTPTFGSFAACAACVVATENAFPPPCFHNTLYGAVVVKKCVKTTGLVSLEPRGTVKETPRSGPEAVALSSRVKGQRYRRRFRQFLQ